MSVSAFNQVAAQYDLQFTNTTIGRLQRGRIWKYLDATFAGKTLDILELNCGTGEDALFFARQGHKVLATDDSFAMLENAKAKLKLNNQPLSLTFQRLDLRNPSYLSQKFDLIFSNFGGVNCLSPTEVKNLAEFTSGQLKRGGHCIFVIMPQSTVMAKWYRRMKGQEEIYNQRKNPNGITVKLGDRHVQTYFYNSETMIQYLDKLDLVTAFSVGLIPSYFNKSKYLKILISIDHLFSIFKLNPNFSDHYLIHFSKN